MILELDKKYIREEYNGNMNEAIRAGEGLLWDADRIKNAFAFGNGTEKDLQQYIKNNKQYCYFVEV